MKERPIMFSAPMVRALLEGRKTQTRRALKPQPPAGTGPLGIGWYAEAIVRRNGEMEPGTHRVCGAWSDDGEWTLECPYGEPGDRLRVKETWMYRDWTEDGRPYIGYRAGGDELKHPPANHCERVADTWAQLSARNRPDGEPACDSRWRSPIFMPRWASRITLEIVSIRVERVQSISDADAVAEGVRPGEYAALWDSINGKTYPWASNPWVWVLAFNREAK